jgi:hypothetical protein
MPVANNISAMRQVIRLSLCTMAIECFAMPRLAPQVAPIESHAVAPLQAFVIYRLVNMLGDKRAKSRLLLCGKACGQQVNAAKGADLGRDGDLRPLEIAPHLRSDEPDQQSEDDAERRQHPRRECL